MPTISEGSPTEIRLRLKDSEYVVLVGEDLLDQASGLITSHTGCSPKKVAIVTDSTVGPLYASRVEASLREAGADPVLITVPAGEASKSMECATDVCRQMLRAGLDRKSLLVALGGGVVGDLAGFAAAIFQRGIPCVQIPTTVVSQVDSSVGGKTGVNTPEGKNLIGAFHQPQLVLADVATLSSLPDREFNEGFAEIIKHAAIRDGEMLQKTADPAASRNEMVSLVARNVAIKAAVVEEDEKETSGTRALLNFGHTIGHGIEAAGGYGRFLHGEAISLGLVAATRLSIDHAGLPEDEAAAILSCLEAFSLPTVLPGDVDTGEILAAMATDKKFQDGQIRFVLVRKLGDAFVSPDITLGQIEAEIERLRS